MQQAKNIFNKSFTNLSIGTVFTPLDWAIFAIEQFNIYKKWMDGAMVFDPTLGTANLLEALVAYGLNNGKKINELPTHLLFGNELNVENYQIALRKFREKYGIDMSRNFSNDDFLRIGEKPYDMIFGNPPWRNFTDLPEEYKQTIKSDFLKYDLTVSKKNLLLGNSRIDLATLVIKRSIEDFLRPDGEAAFFLPLSILLNSGANQNFRTYQTKTGSFSIEKIFDFGKTDIFSGVATRNGLVHFSNSKKISFPIPYYILNNAEWIKKNAAPIFEQTDPLSILENDDTDLFQSFSLIQLPKVSVPRQGINTCGANDVFFFDTCIKVGKENCLLSNKAAKDILLPQAFIFPVVSAADFSSKQNNETQKWILLPYNKNGNPLTLTELKQHNLLYDYLLKNKEKLISRKGVLINAQIKRGIWWALLGVGAYCFSPYKIIWEAYGRSAFRPKIFTGNRQANQSLHAYIPLHNKKDADSVLNQLQNPVIEQYLLSLRMEGSMNWAQPGKIKKLLRITDN